MNGFCPRQRAQNEGFSDRGGPQGGAIGIRDSGDYAYYAGPVEGESARCLHQVGRQRT